MNESTKPDLVFHCCLGNEWLHVYAQPFNHMPVRIVGTREGLVSLRKSIEAALDGENALYGAMVAADGEGYWIEVEISTAEIMQDMPLPYTDYDISD